MIALSAVMLYWALRQVNLGELRKAVAAFNLWWLLPALLFFNLSQLLSARRQQVMLAAQGYELPYRLNVYLYYLGIMFNLLLPGSVGGDGYKCWRLKQQHRVPWRLSLPVMLADRGTGLSGLLAVLAVLVLVQRAALPQLVVLLAAVYLVLFLPITWVGLRVLGRRLTRTLVPCVSLSLVLQTMQLLGALCLLQGFVHTGHWADYGLAFMASSVATALPLSVGGVGLREVAVTSLAQVLPLSESVALAVGLGFTIMSLLSCVPGLVLFIRGHEHMPPDVTAQDDEAPEAADPTEAPTQGVSLQQP